jgi:hypothetical protein
MVSQLSPTPQVVAHYATKLEPCGNVDQGLLLTNRVPNVVRYSSGHSALNHQQRLKELVFFDFSTPYY